MTFEETLRVAMYTALATLVVNVVFHWLKNKFDWFLDRRKFKREYNYNQLKELYLYLYAIVVQSEFIRYFENISDEFNETPFLELHKTKKTQTIALVSGEVTGKSVSIQDAITEFNKQEVYERIIDKASFASQDLLKLAVAYRFLHDHYLKDFDDQQRLDKFQVEEVIIIGKIVKLIIFETNEKLRMCNMEYNKDELNDKLLDNKIYLKEEISKEI